MLCLGLYPRTTSPCASVEDLTKIFVASLFIRVQKEKSPCICQRRKNKQTIVYSYTMFPVRHERERVSDRYSMDKSHRNYAGWKQTDPKVHVLMSLLPWGSGSSQSNSGSWLSPCGLGQQEGNMRGLPGIEETLSILIRVWVTRACICQNLSNCPPKICAFRVMWNTPETKQDKQQTPPQIA